MLLPDELPLRGEDDAGAQLGATSSACVAAGSAGVVLSMGHRAQVSTQVVGGVARGPSMCSSGIKHINVASWVSSLRTDRSFLGLAAAQPSPQLLVLCF